MCLIQDHKKKANTNRSMNKRRISSWSFCSRDFMINRLFAALRSWKYLGSWSLKIWSPNGNIWSYSDMWLADWKIKLLMWGKRHSAYSKTCWLCVGGSLALICEKVKSSKVMIKYSEKCTNQSKTLLKHVPYLSKIKLTWISYGRRCNVSTQVQIKHSYRWSYKAIKLIWKLKTNSRSRCRLLLRQRTSKILSKTTASSWC